MSDKAFSLFVNIYNEAYKNKPKDPITGLPTSSVDIQYNVQNFNKTDPLATSQENKSGTYDVVNSVINENEWINYQGNSKTNNYIPFSSTPDFIEDISLPSIIDWTQNNHPSMKLIYGHFAYLNDFGKYPANRLMVLRRFSQGIQNDLFTLKGDKVKPLYTMCTWYDEEKIPFSISFKEKWTLFKDSIMEVLQDVVGIKFKTGGVLDTLSNATSTPMGQDIVQKFGAAVGIVTSGENILGDPNTIYEASIRDVDGEDVQTGLECDIKIEFETTFIMREAGGIDAHAAMLMILAEAVHMGTSNSRYYITGNAGDQAMAFIEKIRTGDIEGLFESIVEGLKDILAESLSTLVKAGTDLIKNVQEKGVVATLSKATTDLLVLAIKTRYQRYKWKITGAISALAGLPTAPWHITMGNPKSPWLMCGNLILDSANIDFVGELGYNDVPEKIVVKYSLKNGATIGASEITSIFNKGKGRIYESGLEKIKTVKVPEGQDYAISGSPSQNNQNNSTNKNSGITQQDNVEQVDTNKTNDLKASGIPSNDFGLNNYDNDNNIPKSSNNSVNFFKQ
jgi:hypothetical protein